MVVRAGSNGFTGPVQHSHPKGEIEYYERRNFEGRRSCSVEVMDRMTQPGTTTLMTDRVCARDKKTSKVWGLGLP